MSITAIGAVVPPPEASLQTRQGARLGPDFAVVAEPPLVQRAGNDATARATVALAGSMLALQEIGPPHQGAGRVTDREARRRGRDVLAALAAIQRDLLDASDAEAALLRLRASLSDLPEAEDPGLAGILVSIRLRAGIESIRLGRLTAAHRPLL
ncbi:flagellar assembly protein FliX [Lichenicoccus roseus]|nr:flagellar assembly protein FliX [Lichenicoccus roseus]